jgi:hypothetical protein
MQQGTLATRDAAGASSSHYQSKLPWLLFNADDGINVVILCTGALIHFGMKTPLSPFLYHLDQLLPRLRSVGLLEQVSIHSDVTADNFRLFSFALIAK